MVPDKFNMVDMGGIDLIMMRGEEVPGLYMRLVESIARCRYQCLYNWLFDGVVIPPTYVELRIGDEDEVIINEGITVTDDDAIHIYSIEPGPDPPVPEPEIIPLLAEENGVYNVPAGKDGFNPVTVNVPSYTPVINPLAITENGIYTPSSGVDGYSPVTVNVSGSSIVEEWNFKESFVGSERDIVITPSNVVRDSNGAIFNAANCYLSIPIRLPFCTIELYIGQMNLTSGSNRRFVMKSDSEGLIYRTGGKWSFYAANAWATDSDITDGSFFANSTLKIVVDSSYYWHIYKDNILVYEPNRPLEFSASNIRIGSSSSSILNAVIEGLRIL